MLELNKFVYGTKGRRAKGVLDQRKKKKKNTGGRKIRFWLRTQYCRRYWGGVGGKIYPFAVDKEKRRTNKKKTNILYLRKG